MAQAKSEKIYIPEEAFFDPRLDCVDKMLLAEVNRLDDGIGCIVEDGYLGKLLGISRTKVAGRISSLVSIGYIEKSEGAKGNRVLQVADVAGNSERQSPNNLLPEHFRACKLDHRGIPIVDLPDVLRRIPGFVQLWDECLGYWNELHLNLTEKVIIKKVERLEDQLDPCETVHRWNIKSLKALGRIPTKRKKGSSIKRTPTIDPCSGCGRKFENESERYGHVCPNDRAMPDSVKRQIAEMGRQNIEARQRHTSGFAPFLASGK